MNKQGLLLIDHGSTKKEANELLYDIRALILTLQPHLPVAVSHMEIAEPSIKDGIQLLLQENVSHIIVHPYMLGPGRHASKDIPRMIDELKPLFPTIIFHITEPLGADIALAQLVLKRAGI